MAFVFTLHNMSLQKDCLDKFLDQQVYFVVLLSEGGHFCPRGSNVRDLFAAKSTVASHAWPLPCHLLVSLKRSVVNGWSIFLLAINPRALFGHASHVPFPACVANRDDWGQGSSHAEVLRATPTNFSHYFLGLLNSWGGGGGRGQCFKNSTVQYVSHDALKVVGNTYQTPSKWRDVGSFGFNSMAFCKI